MSASPLDQIGRRLTGLAAPLRRRLPVLERTPAPSVWMEWAARLGYGARGFVYLSAGLITLLAAMDLTGQAAGTGDAIGMVARQPLGRVWLIVLGAGLWAFVLWRVLQSVFDADHQGMSRKALAVRAGQGVSGVFYALIASTIFEVLDEFEPDPGADDVAENQEKAAMLLSLPYGDLLLIAVGLVVLAVGIGNIVKGLTADFTDELACSPDLCRRVSPIARAGYVARGAAYLPLALFTVLAGAHSQVGEVTSFGDALQALEGLPAGPWVLGATAVGIMAFGAFAMVEARFRRIRPPKHLD